MSYEPTIHFTLDTICPWTYIAKKRLGAARHHLSITHPNTRFHLVFHPYQLHDDAPERGENKYTWYLHNKYHSSEVQMRKYVTVMSALGASEGIRFKFGGVIANTLNAHRVIQWVQDTAGEETTERFVDVLYRLYFEEEQCPSSSATLLQAAREAGLEGDEVGQVVRDEDVGMAGVKAQVREQAMNGVDAVPYVVVEGRRRDFTLVGAKEVGEYVRTLERVVAESV